MADTPEDVEGLASGRRAEARPAPRRARGARRPGAAVLTSSEAVIAALKLEILKLRRELYGQRSERGRGCSTQMELQLEELEATASEDELRAEQAAARASTPVRAFTRRRPARKPFPEHLPRERVVIEAPADLRLLRLRADREARRGRHRDAGSRPAPVEGDPDRAREVHLPGLRADHPTAGALPPDARAAGRARTCWR